MLLGVLSEGEIAFGASEEEGWAFVSASGLDLPEVGGVVFAFWARYFLYGHGADVIFFSDDRYCFFFGVADFFGVVSGVVFSWFFVSTFLAHEP